MKSFRTPLLALLFLAGLAGCAFAQIRTISGQHISPHAMDRFLEQQLDSFGLPALSIAIINNGKIVYQRAIGISSTAAPRPADQQSVFEAASLSKPVFAYLVMKMVEKRVLALDTPLYRYLPFPEMAHDGRYRLITARMVLDHTTGFPNWRWFDLADPKLNVKRGDMYFKFAPGTFSYSGEAYTYLARVIAHLNNATLQTLDALFRREVAAPLGMEHAYFSWSPYVAQHKVAGHFDRKVSNKNWPVAYPEQDSSWFGAAGGLHTDAKSYARFLIAMMEGKGLTKASMEEMLKEQMRIPVSHERYNKDGITAWGLGIAIAHTPWGIQYKHGGNNGDFTSGCLFYKQQRYGYVFFTNCNKGDAFNKKLEALLVN